MAILITGGCGYIGSHAVLTLMNADYDVVVLDDFSNSSRHVISRLEALSGKQLVVYDGSVLNSLLLKEIFTKHNVSDVIHFAGSKSVNESIKEPLYYYENNVSGTLILLKTMLQANVKNIIFSSSATVYGSVEKIPLTEDCYVGNTTNPYGSSKLIAEKILSDICLSNQDFNATILRYFNPVGAHESGEIGESPRGVPNNLLPYITQVAIGKLPLLKIYGSDYSTPDGTGVRDFIHVMDLAEGHLAALKHRNKTKNLNVYNLGTGRGYSVLELVKAFENISGIKIPYEIVSRRPGDIAECWSDSSLAMADLNWSAKRSLDDMMRDSWNWQKNNPNGYE